MYRYDINKGPESELKSEPVWSQNKEQEWSRSRNRIISCPQYCFFTVSESTQSINYRVPVLDSTSMMMHTIITFYQQLFLHKIKFTSIQQKRKCLFVRVYLQFKKGRTGNDLLYALTDMLVF